MSERERAMAGILGTIARLGGVDVRDDEIEAALLACSTERHDDDVCALVALMHRKYDEQGIDKGHGLDDHRPNTEV